MFNFIPWVLTLTLLIFHGRSRDEEPATTYEDECWQQIAFGEGFAVGVTSKGDLCTLGCSRWFRLASNKDEDPDDWASEPRLVDKSMFSKKVKYVTCGCHHIVVLTTDGDLYTW